MRWCCMVALPALRVVALGAPWTIDWPELRGFNFVGGLTLAPEYFALLIALVTYTSAFIAEIVRSGIQAVPQGQWDAAKALGLRRSFVLRQIVLPQALRVIIPPMTSQYLNLTKNSSLAVAIGYQDIVSIANTTLNQTGQAIEAIALIMAGVPHHQPRHQLLHELVQCAHRAGGALSHDGDDRQFRTARCRSPRRAAGRRRSGASRWLRANLFASIPSPIIVAAADRSCSARRSSASCSGASLNAVWSVPDEQTQRLPRRARHRRLLGGDPRKISLHPVRHLSVRRAVAAGAGGAAVHRAVLSSPPAAALWRKELA